jgi:hypothetical protein
MSYLAAHPTRVLACLVAMACGARAEEATNATPTADQSKVTVGAMLMSDYIYRGISYSGHQPSVAAYVDARNRAGSTATRISTASGSRPARPSR